MGRCMQVFGTALWLRTSHPWCRAGCKRQCLFAGAQVLLRWPQSTETPPGVLVPISTVCVKTPYFACALGLQRSVMCPTDMLTAWAGWEKCQRNPFSSEFAGMEICVYEVPMKAGQSSTAISPVAWQATWSASRFVVFRQPGLPWLPIAGWGKLRHRPAQLQDLLPIATILNGLYFLLSGKV